MKACEETADKLKEVTAENGVLKEKISLRDEKLDLKDEKIAVKDEQIVFWKAAAQKGNQIDTNNGLIVVELRRQHSEDLAEIDRLRRENDSLRSSRNWRTALGFGAGFATGYFTKK